MIVFGSGSKVESNDRMDSILAILYLISIAVICPNVGCLNLETNFLDKRRKISLREL